MRATAAKPVLLPDVLRIGIVRNGRVVEERLVRAGEDVTVGDAPRNTFVVTSLRGSHRVFRAGRTGHVLSLPADVPCRVAVSGGTAELAEVAPSVDGRRELELTERSRGKVILGDTTLLFQRMEAPPEPIRAPTDFRPRIWEDDPLFSGLLTVFSIAAAGFAILVASALPPEPPELPTPREIAGFEPVSIYLPPPPPVALAPEPPPPTRPAAGPAATRPVEAVPSLDLRSIGTEGRTGTNLMTEIFGEDDIVGLDAALEEVRRDPEASRVLTMKVGSTGREDVSLRSRLLTSGDARTGEGAVTKIARLTPEKPPPTEEGPVDVASRVRSYNPRVQTCVERSLKADHAMGGRIAVEWDIRAGRVVEPRIVDDTTGDPDVGSCIVGVVRGMRFDAGLDTSNAGFAWIVSGG